MGSVLKNVSGNEACVLEENLTIIHIYQGEPHVRVGF